MSELSITDPDRKERKTMKLDKGAMKILAYGKTQQLINNKVVNGGKDKDNMSALDEETSKRSTVLADPHDQKNLKIFKECQDSAQCIIWWINRALAYLEPFRGKCTRKIQCTGPIERNYYQPGKIFRFQNIISATMGDGLDNSDYNEGSAIWFHIFSQSGRCIKDFIPQDSSQ